MGKIYSWNQKNDAKKFAQVYLGKVKVKNFYHE